MLYNQHLEPISTSMSVGPQPYTLHNLRSSIKNSFPHLFCPRQAALIVAGDPFLHPVLITCPYHLSLPLLMKVVIGSTPTSLLHSSFVLLSFNEIPHIHLVPSQAITGCLPSQTISMIQAVIESSFPHPFCPHQAVLIVAGDPFLHPVLITWPYHLSLPLLMKVVIGSTPTSILNSSFVLLSFNEIPHIHLVPSQAITGCPPSQTISMIQTVIES